MQQRTEYTTLWSQMEFWRLTGQLHNNKLLCCRSCSVLSVWIYSIIEVYWKCKVKRGKQEGERKGMYMKQKNVIQSVWKESGWWMRMTGENRRDLKVWTTQLPNCISEILWNSPNWESRNCRKLPENARGETPIWEIAKRVNGENAKKSKRL